MLQGAGHSWSGVEIFFQNFLAGSVVALPFWTPQSHAVVLSERR
jgi:hypothetical protein